MYQPLPFNWKLVLEIRRRTFRLHRGQRESGGLVMRCISSKSPLAASVSEMPDAVRLRIKASGDVEPGSVEVRFAGRQAVVLARDAEGRTIRSQPLRLPAPVVEEGSSADYDADGALVMTFRKLATAQDAGPMGDPEAAAR